MNTQASDLFKPEEVKVVDGRQKRILTDVKSSLLWYSMATRVHANVFAMAINVRFAADNAGTVLKK